MHTITLTVTDDDDLTASDEVVVTVEAAPYDPRVTDGLQVLYNFAEGEGSVVHDVSGVGTPIDLTIANPAATTWIYGGLSIDQSTQNFTVGPNG